MAQLQQMTRDFLTFLRDNPAIRVRFCAAHGKTRLYAGHFFTDMWKEIARTKLRSPELGDKQILTDVLEHIPVPGKSYPNLLRHVSDVVGQLKPHHDGDCDAVWQKLLEIYASNASGPVSFMVGNDVDSRKIFASNELPTLLANPKVNALTKDILAYYQRCLQFKRYDMNFGYISG